LANLTSNGARVDWAKTWPCKWGATD